MIQSEVQSTAWLKCCGLGPKRAVHKWILANWNNTVKKSWQNSFTTMWEPDSHTEKNYLIKFFYKLLHNRVLFFTFCFSQDCRVKALFGLTVFWEFIFGKKRFCGNCGFIDMFANVGISTWALNKFLKRFKTGSQLHHIHTRAHTVFIHRTNKYRNYIYIVAALTGNTQVVKLNLLK